MHIYSQTPTLVYILFNIYIHVSKYNLILYAYILMYICIYISILAYMHMCVCYTVCASACTHTQNKYKEMKAWHNLHGAMDHIHTLKAIISTRRGPSTIEYGDEGSLIVHQAGICRYVCVSILTHTHAHTHTN